MGIGFVIVGAACLLLSFTTLDWYSGSVGPDTAGSSAFSDLHHNASMVGADGLTTSYFSWTSWLLLILVIVVGTSSASCSAQPAQRAGMRVAGLLLGLIGAALTYYALHNISFSGKIFDHAAAGVWLAFAGYLLAGHRLGDPGHGPSYLKP